MITLKTTSEKIIAWLRNREAVREWSQFSDHELCHIRVRRSVVEDIVRGQIQRRADN
jgi:uncharacterized protein YjiS (DUF1127 family)